MKRTILVTGAGGQLGRELIASAGPDVDCVALSRSQLNIADGDAIATVIDQHKPDAVINAAAYTAVDAAESEPENAALANVAGPENLARACSQSGARLIHVSTDFVFDGRASHPYSPDARPAPINAYGRTKLEGERAVHSLYPKALILRTGWLYSRHGGNFVITMLRLMRERDELAVVADQVGTPTWAKGLAEAIWAALAREELSGIYHWSDAGVCSWYDFAVAICEEACQVGLLPRPIVIRPIPGSSYPTPATRPSYSVLDKQKSWNDFEIAGEHWRVQLRSMLQGLKETEHE